MMTREALRTFFLSAAAMTLAVSVTTLSAGEKAMGTNAEAAFESLKGMEGTWTGHFEDPEGHEKMESVHVFEVSAAGTVVMETMGPGTAQEMINMYHLDGEDLMLTHYCSAGNQPVMRLNRKTSSGKELVFDFAGGTNFDPAEDSHIHSARLEITGEDAMNSIWVSWDEGKEMMSMEFHIVRK